VRDFHAFGEVGRDFPFRLGITKYVHNPNGIRYQLQTQCNDIYELGSAPKKAASLTARP
jgi:hypothetical protein